MNTELKIYEIQFGGDKDWVSAYTNLHAVRVWSIETGFDINDIEADDEIVEVPKEDWGKHFVTNSDYPAGPGWEKITFTEYMEANEVPDHIATTREP